jgi:spore germination cell wall hydrolase CwlJ-like protein
MNLDLRILLLAATVTATVPIASATLSASQGPANTPTKKDDPRNPNPSAATPEAEAGDAPKPGSESADKNADEHKGGNKKAEQRKAAKKPANRSESKGIDSELRCLAMNIYHEARSESETGQEAVAAVTLNRVKSKSFPNSVCKVVKQGSQKRNRCQFSWWCDGKSDQVTEKAAWQRALEIGRESLLGVRGDPTNGATFYHTLKVRPRWSRKFRRTARIGDHIFYSPTRHKSVKVVSAR